MRIRILSLCAVIVVLSACHRGGGQGLTTPSVVAPQAVTVVSGRTGQPIPTLGGLQGMPGQTLTLAATGFFTLKTGFRAGPISLWPADDGYLPAVYTRAFVYSNADPGQLHRLPQSVSVVSVTADAAILGTVWTANHLQKAVETLSQVHPALDFQLGGAGGFTVAITVNVADAGFVTHPGAAMLTYVQTDAGGTITSAKIVVRSLDLRGFWYTQEYFQSAITHELIHTTGLDHLWSGDKGLMSGTADAYGFLAPTEREVLVMKLQYLRPAGTVLQGMVETEGGVKASSGSPEWHLVCAHARSGRE